MCVSVERHCSRRVCVVAQMSIAEIGTWNREQQQAEKEGYKYAVAGVLVRGLCAIEMLFRIADVWVMRLFASFASFACLHCSCSCAH